MEWMSFVQGSPTCFVVGGNSVFERNLKAEPSIFARHTKNLPLSVGALRDSYLAVFNPSTKAYELFQSLVLPFGARPAVQGFYRVAAAMWFLALAFLQAALDTVL